MSIDNDCELADHERSILDEVRNMQSWVLFGLKVLVFRTMFGIKFGEILASNSESSAFSFVFNFLIFVMTDECGEKQAEEKAQNIGGIASEIPESCYQRCESADDHDGRCGKDKRTKHRRKAKTIYQKCLQKFE